MEITTASLLALLEGGAWLVNAALRAQKGELSQAEVDSILDHIRQEGGDLRAAIDRALAKEGDA
ncbi:MAG: hypothetical protein K9G33_08360 [Sneathiella sp.]|nr:hypothetical protein [Sneathiella sp.]